MCLCVAQACRHHLSRVHPYRAGVQSEPDCSSPFYLPTRVWNGWVTKNAALNPKSAVEDLLETRNNSLAAPRPSARPLWSEGTASHPFFASRRPNRPAGLRFDSFLLPNSVDAARLCQHRARAGERSGASGVVGRIERVSHGDSYHAPVRRAVPFHPLS